MDAEEEVEAGEEVDAKEVNAKEVADAHNEAKEEVDAKEAGADEEVGATQ